MDNDHNDGLAEFLSAVLGVCIAAGVGWFLWLALILVAG